MEFEIIKKVFENENPSSIFEVGCTAGMLFKSYYDESNEELIVGGLDFFPVEAAKGIYPKCAENFFQWDATKTPYPIADNSFDIVFTIGTLLLIPDPYPVIKEMLRICKDKIIIAEQQDWQCDDYGISTHLITGDTPEQQKEGMLQPVDFNYTRIKRDYEKVFKKLGLKIDIKETYIDKTIIKCKKI